MSEERKIKAVTVEYIDGRTQTWTGKGNAHISLTHHQENYSPKGPHESYVSINMSIDEE